MVIVNPCPNDERCRIRRVCWLITPPVIYHILHNDGDSRVLTVSFELAMARWMETYVVRGMSTTLSDMRRWAAGSDTYIWDNNTHNLSKTSHVPALVCVPVLCDRVKIFPPLCQPRFLFLRRPATD